MDYNVSSLLQFHEVEKCVIVYIYILYHKTFSWINEAFSSDYVVYTVELV